MSGDDRWQATTAAFFAVHDGDPAGEARRYHETVARWVDTLDPAAPEVVRLAALAQHIERWTIPRSDFPEGRDGYRAWRSKLGLLHARRAGEILQAQGWPAATAKRVGELLIKKRLKSDAEVALLEDAVCLTFLELQLAEFAARKEPDQVVDILRKTWGKMTHAGQAAARSLLPSLPEAARQLVERAL